MTELLKEILTFIWRLYTEYPNLVLLIALGICIVLLINKREQNKNLSEQNKNLSEKLKGCEEERGWYRKNALELETRRLELLKRQIEREIQIELEDMPEELKKVSKKPNSE